LFVESLAIEAGQSLRGEDVLREPIKKQSSRTYATAGAFRRALEERLKSMSKTERIDINHLRRQVSVRSVEALP
jgi:hypothetical protein